MNIATIIVLRKKHIRLKYIALIIATGLIACNSALPFSYVSEPPKNRFLFVFIFDDNEMCLDGLCDCPVSEEPVIPFEFRDGKLILNQYTFEMVPTNWVVFRESQDAIALHGDENHLKIYSSFPIETTIGDITVLGTNSQGDIQIMADNEYVIIPTGSKITTEKPEKIFDGCKILHRYTLTNYGFIKDENVEFYWVDELK